MTLAIFSQFSTFQCAIISHLMQKCSLIFQVCSYAYHYLTFFREPYHMHGVLIKIILFRAIRPLITKPKYTNCRLRLKLRSRFSRFWEPLTQVIVISITLKSTSIKKACKNLWDQKLGANHLYFKASKKF